MNALLFDKTKKASLKLSSLSDKARNAVLLRLADAIVAEADTLLTANAEDLQKREPSDPLYDRLQLTKERLEGIAADMRKVVSLPDPLGRVLVDRVLPNGLQLRKVSVPFGVIGVIYESRPNVTFDVFSLCFKSGNACLLKGGRDAQQSNLAAVALIKRVLESMAVDTDVVNLLPATHEAAQDLLSAVGYVDVLAEFLLADGPDAVARDFALHGAFEGDIQEELALFLGAEQDAVTLARLVAQDIFAALDDDCRLRFVRFHAFGRILAAYGMRFSLEIPESEIAAELFAGTGNVERREVDEGAGAVVEYELVAPGFVEFFGGIRVRHEIAYGKGPFGTFRGNDVDSEG